jgi:LAO/AO transport system kinase
MSGTPTSDAATMLDAARGGDRVALARLLTWVERGGDLCRAVVSLAYATPGASYTVGITGSPGAGKSTLTDRLIGVGRTRGFDGPGAVAVIAIDPTSPFSGGAILGDRVRMQGHATDDGVFIRSMATKGHLGGLALAVPDAIRVLSAVGMPIVIVETVGVGQQEVEVAAAADTTVVVVNPGWGDAVQANKAGLLEIADLFVINKADRPGARETKRDLELMLDLSAPGDWRPPIVSTVAQAGDGVDDLWAAISDHRRHLIEGGQLEVIRRRRLERELRQILAVRVDARVAKATDSGRVASMVEAMLAGKLDPYAAADRLLGEALGGASAPGSDGS